VGHACNPSYSGGRDQEDHSSKRAWSNSSGDPISKNKKPSQNRDVGVAQGVGLEFKPQNCKKKKKKKERKKERKRKRNQCPGSLQFPPEAQGFWLNVLFPLWESRSSWEVTGCV
jgi:hypothetical protein